MPAPPLPASGGAGVGPRQLRLRKTHRLPHHSRDLLVGVALDVVQPDHRAGGFGQPLQRRLQIHPERGILATHRGHLVLQLVGVPVLVAPEPHQRLARRDGPDPAPEAAIPPEPPDAPADLEKRLLEHVLRVLGGPADPPGQVVHGRLERPEERLEGGGVAGPGPGQHRLRVRHEIGIHEERSGHGTDKDAGKALRVANGLRGAGWREMRARSTLGDDAQDSPVRLPGGRGPERERRFIDLGRLRPGRQDMKSLIVTAALLGIPAVLGAQAASLSAADSALVGRILLAEDRRDCVRPGAGRRAVHTDARVSARTAGALAHHRFGRSARAIPCRRSPRRRSGRTRRGGSGFARWPSSAATAARSPRRWPTAPGRSASGPPICVTPACADNDCAGRHARAVGRRAPPPCGAPRQGRRLLAGGGARPRRARAAAAGRGAPPRPGARAPSPVAGARLCRACGGGALRHRHAAPPRAGPRRQREGIGDRRRCRQLTGHDDDDLYLRALRSNGAQAVRAAAIALKGSPRADVRRAADAAFERWAARAQRVRSRRARRAARGGRAVGGGRPAARRRDRSCRRTRSPSPWGRTSGCGSRWRPRAAAARSSSAFAATRHR